MVTYGSVVDPLFLGQIKDGWCGGPEVASGVSESFLSEDGEGHQTLPKQIPGWSL